ncbi:MAG: phosphoglucomutase/phosphomannomutase family protein [candidate division NC10 bacterium]|nr:phosphoglucomutase/phosphomannomutase family protein [candidate division NC10 bacterium]
MVQIKFGTSGWRGIIAEDFTFTNVRIVAQAIAEYLVMEGLTEKGVVIGYDTRFLSEAFAAEAAKVLAANGVHVFFCSQPTPTPAISHEILRRGAGGAINFTASHNPPEYNGIKFSSEWGGPALPGVTGRVEARANQLLRDPRVPLIPLGLAEARGLLERIDPRPPYLEKLRQIVNYPVLRESQLKVVLDPLYGTARGYLDAACSEAGCHVKTLHSIRDPYFGGRPPEPTEENLGELCFEVVETGSHLGLATDGDADRFGVVDADGTLITPNQLLALLLKHLVKSRGWKGAVARSVATSHLIDAVARKYGIEVYETAVGFKYIGDLISQDRIIIGGEESAGLSIKGHVPEKDGILACLLAAEMVAASGRSRLKALLGELYAEVGTVLSRRYNFQVTEEEKRSLMERLKDPPLTWSGLHVIEVNALVEGIKLLLEDGSWVLVRLSGTEPMVRLYVEGSSEDQLRELAEAGRQFIYG